VLPRVQLLGQGGSIVTAHVATVAFQGVEAVPVDVQVHIASGFVGFTVVGLGDKAVAKAANGCAPR
jgi:hypothetical protein